MRVYVEGRLNVREYVGQDGQTRTSVDVRAFEVQFLDRPGDSGGGQGGDMGGGGGGYAPGAPPEGAGRPALVAILSTIHREETRQIT